VGQGVWRILPLFTINPRGTTMKMGTLPPDPEKMNDDRANRGAVIIRQFQNMTGYCSRHALESLLCDLMHWADRNRARFDDDLSAARIYYAAETSRAIEIMIDALNDIAAGKGDAQEIAADAVQSAPNGRSSIDPDEILF
jgi:hypothetical protein